MVGTEFLMREQDEVRGGGMWIYRDAKVSGHVQREGKAHEEKKNVGYPQHFKLQMKTYVEATVNKVDVLKAREVKRAVAIYNVLKDDLYRFERAFLGRVDVPGSSYNIQNLFHVEGYFSVKVTPL
ncbi:hypothetical protein KIW84_041061 [Lathyrus oleraceus]|uniref:Uncharacterized protein n=1 Tax=Pisum sativum TaxID=3888 RepID=A0A9D4X986_PEA|nr:hypothetical protein KIW84_041061 [Pisum sativum]